MITTDIKNENIYIQKEDSIKIMDPNDPLIKIKDIKSRISNKNESELKNLKTELTNFQALQNQDSKAFHKCKKIMGFISKIIEAPTLLIKTEHKELQLNTSLLALNSSFIKQLLERRKFWNEAEEISIDLNEHDPEIIEEMLLFFEKDDPNVLQTKNLLSLAYLADLLQSKKLSFVCEKKLMEQMDGYSFRESDDARDMIELFNFAADKPAFQNLAKLIEKELSLFILNAFQEKTEDILKERLELLKQNLTALPTLDFDHSLITEDQLQMIKELPFKGLRLSGCRKLTFNVWNLLKLMDCYQYLEILDLSCHSFVNDEVCEDLGCLPLRELQLNACLNVTDAGIENLPLTLEKLSLNNNKNISSISCKYFNRMPFLKELFLNDCLSLIDADVQHLPLTLEKLGLSNNLNLGQFSCCHIGKMTQLRELILSCCKGLTDGDIQKLPLSLVILHLDGNPNISQLSCQRINQMRFIKELNLMGCTILTDLDIKLLPLTLESVNLSLNQNILSSEHLGQMANLKNLSIFSCKGLRDADIQQLPLTLERLDA
jgi:hypothetical protein